MGGVAIFNIIMNSLLIPYYSCYGAVISTIASELVLLLLYRRAVTKFVFN
jgi:O-antigen/teichoic acid export membrane protein